MSCFLVLFQHFLRLFTDFLPKRFRLEHLDAAAKAQSPVQSLNRVGKTLFHKKPSVRCGLAAFAIFFRTVSQGGVHPRPKPAGRLGGMGLEHSFRNGTPFKALPPMFRNARSAPA